MGYTIKVVGESFGRRQKAIRRIKVGDDALLVRQPGNAHDPNAIEVVVRGAQVGMVGRENAEWLADAMDKGKVAVAHVDHVAASGSGHLGVVLDVEIEGEGKTRDTERKRYLDEDAEEATVARWTCGLTLAITIALTILMGWLLG